MSDVCVNNPKEFVDQAERVLKTISLEAPEYMAMRSKYINDACMLFGSDVASEIDDALPGPVSSKPINAS